MTAFQTSIARHVDLDVTTVDVFGPLSVATAVTMVETVRRCAAECPGTVILDLSGCDLESLDALGALPGVGLTGERLPSVPIVLVAPDARLRAAGGAVVLGAISRFDKGSDAMAFAAQHRSGHPQTRLAFEPVPGAPAQAREVVRATCQQWGLASLSPDLELVASELVTNVVLYARTAGAMELLHQDGFLRLRVTDGSSQPPESFPGGMPPGGAMPMDHGRGLPLVQLLSTAWGCLIDHRGPGKVVWATFSPRP
jgi:hypothetical protein